MRAAATKVRAGRAAEDTPSWRQRIGTRKNREWNYKQKWFEKTKYEKFVSLKK